MARKDRQTHRHRELAAHIHMVEYITMFIRKYERPRRKYPKLNEALEEVGRIRMLLSAEAHGAPPLRVPSKSIDE